MLAKILKPRWAPLLVLLAATIIMGLVAILSNVADQPDRSVSASDGCAFNGPGACPSGKILSINKAGNHGVIQRDDDETEFAGALYQFRIPEGCALSADNFCTSKNPATVGDMVGFDTVAPRARLATDVYLLSSGDCPPFC